MEELYARKLSAWGDRAGKLGRRYAWGLRRAGVGALPVLSSTARLVAFLTNSTIWPPATSANNVWLAITGLL